MSTSSRNLPFPHNLSPGQRKCIVAVDRHGTIVAAAAALGIAEGTVQNNLKRARLRCGVNTTDALVKRFMRAAA